MRLVDPDGRCSAPAGITTGSIGVCIEAFISSKWVPGTAGRGDNRTFSGTNGDLTSRLQVRFLIDLATGRYSTVEKRIGESVAVTKPFASTGFGGAAISSETTGSGTALQVGAYAFNGFLGFWRAPTSPLSFSVGLDVGKGGKVTLDPLSTFVKLYPSYAAYLYGADGSTTKLFEQSESDPGWLNAREQQLRDQSLNYQTLSEQFWALRTQVQ